MERHSDARPMAKRSCAFLMSTAAWAVAPGWGAPICGPENGWCTATSLAAHGGPGSQCGRGARF
eukprot:3145570-Pyramimonas_sp.AAC.1